MPSRQALHPMRTQIEHPNDQLEHAIMSAWLDISGTGMCVVDDTSRVVMLNQAACNMLGVNALDVLNRPLKALFDVVKGAPSLIQWLGVPGFDGEKHATKTDKNGAADLSLKATTLRAHSAAGTVEQFKVISIADITTLKTAQRLIESGALKHHRRDTAQQPTHTDK
jgi:nitrogen fixation/metabolism regulation signal transduction histidine kinase